MEVGIFNASPAQQYPAAEEWEEELPEASSGLQAQDEGWELDAVQLARGLEGTIPVGFGVWLVF